MADEKLPPHRLLLLGFQHVLVMYAGDIAVPLIVSEALHLPVDQTVVLINSSLLVAGVATLIQCLGVWKFGVRLPVMMGATFLSVAPMISMGLDPEIGLQGFYGAVLVSGALGILIAPTVGRHLGLFPPVVSGSVITLLGITLIAVATNWMGGGRPTLNHLAGGVTMVSPNPAFGTLPRLGLAVLVLAVILLFDKFGRGIWRNVAALAGIILGSLAAIPLGEFAAPQASHSSSASGWIAFTLPFQFGPPTFHVSAILTMTIIMLIILVESAAVVLALAATTGHDLSGKEMSAALRADGLGVLLGGIFNAFPYITFSQNVGLVAITGVRSRYVCAAGGFILIALGLVPKLGYLVASIPQPVLGGAGLVMFGMVAATGIRILAKVDFDGRKHDLFIVAVTISCGLIPTLSPSLFQHLPPWSSPITHSGVVLGCVVGVILNLFFNGVASPRAAD
jgi:uric acid transporter